jgi:hypothetical protein
MKLTTAVRRTVADSEPPSLNQIAIAIQKARQQLEDDYRGNVRLLRRQFGDAMVDQALIVMRQKLVKG